MPPPPLTAAETRILPLTLFVAARDVQRARRRYNSRSVGVGRSGPPDSRMRLAGQA